MRCVRNARMSGGMSCGTIGRRCCSGPILRSGSTESMETRRLVKASMGALLATGAAMGSAPAHASASPTPKARRQELYGLLGKLPTRDRKVSAQLVSTEDRGSYVLDK